MKATLRSIGTLAAAAGLSVAGLMAAQAQTFGQSASYSEWVPVISSTPVVERMNRPREECWTDRVTNYETRKVGGISLGAFETSTNYVVPVSRDVQRCRTVDQSPKQSRAMTFAIGTWDASTSHAPRPIRARGFASTSACCRARSSFARLWPRRGVRPGRAGPRAGGVRLMA